MKQSKSIPKPGPFSARVVRYFGFTFRKRKRDDDQSSDDEGGLERSEKGPKTAVLQPVLKASALKPIHLKEEYYTRQGCFNNLRVVEEITDLNQVFLRLDGQNEMTGPISFDKTTKLPDREIVFEEDKGTISGLKDPVSLLDACNRRYVDNGLQKNRDNIISNTDQIADNYFHFDEEVKKVNSEVNNVNSEVTNLTVEVQKTEQNLDFVAKL